MAHYAVGAGVMGTWGNSVHGVWGTGGIGHGAYGQWGTGVWAMGYRGMGHGTYGQWEHRGYEIQGYEQ